MYSKLVSTLIVGLGLLGMAVVPPTSAQDIGAEEAEQISEDATVSQVTRPVAELTDPAQIEELLFELLITPEIPQDSISRVEVIDVALNGFGPDDVIVVHPSQETFRVDPATLTGRVEEMMAEWTMEAEYQVDAGNAPADVFEPVDPLDPQRAEAAIMHELLAAVERNYGNDIPISVLLDRDETGFTVQMWDYDPEAMEYHEPPTGPPDTVLTRDMLHVIRSDSVLYDQVIINRTVEETEYIPEDEPTSALPDTLDRGTRAERLEHRQEMTALPDE